MVEGYLDLASKKADDILKEKGSIEQINLFTNLDEVNYEDCCGVTNKSSDVYIRSQKMPSNSSWTNQDQEGSKYRLKNRKQRSSKNNVGEIVSQSQDNQLAQEL